jgi:HEAT repeat protein
MGIIGAIRTDRLINQVVISGNLDSHASAQAIDKLKSLAATAIPKIIGMLSTAPREETDFIVKMLTKLVSTQTVNFYFQGLADSDSRVVSGVVKALKKAHNVDPNRFLELFDKSDISKPAILEVLFAHREVLNVKQLVRYAYKLQRNDLVMLFRIINELADESLAPELVNRINAKDPVLRTEIAKVLSKFKTKSAQDALHRLLMDRNKSVRLAALEALSKMDASMDVKKLCQLLKDPDLKVQGKTIDAIVKLNHPRTINYLLDPLQDESEYARRAAVEVMNEIANPDAVKDLLLAIKDKDWWVRSRAADALGRIGGKRVVESVIELIRDEDEFVRRSAIEIINATQDKNTYDILVEALTDTDWWVRERAIDGLAGLGNKKAVPLLIKMMQREQRNADTVIVIVRALAKLNSKSAIQPIIGQLSHVQHSVKKEALQALGELADEAHGAAIKKAIVHATEQAEDEFKQLAAEVLLKVNAVYTSKAELPGLENLNPLSVEDTPVGPVNMPGTVSRGMGSLATDTVDHANLQSDDIIGDRYRFIRQVGKGAFGTVLLVKDLMIDEEIILKFLNPQVASDENIIKRFVYELRFARRITHQNVIRIYDMITFGKSSAISMEFFPSHTLNFEMHPGLPMATQRALKVIRDVCAGMASAHNANVVHRDLKPSNVLINDQDIVKIVDFGVASAISQGDTKLTKTGLLIGTPSYMSPEQVLGREVDARTDIYSLGIIMYEMFTGSPPYQGGDSMAIMYQHVQGQVVPPRELDPKIPQTLNAVILKAMALDPDARYQSMDELRERLETFVD